MARNGVKKRIFREGKDVAKAAVGAMARFRNSNPGHKVPHRVSHKEPATCARSPRTAKCNLVNQQQQRSSSVKSSVNPVSEGHASPSSAASSLDVGRFLRDLPSLTRAVATAHLWPKVDMNEALLFQGSVLYKESEGKKWVARPEEFVILY